MITKNDVIELFTILLERKPENDKVIEDHIKRAKNKNHLMKIIRSSKEFQIKMKKKETQIKKLTYEDIFIFLHIPKTAGTLLRERWFFRNKEIMKSHYWINLSIESEKDILKKFANYYNLLPLKMIGGHWQLNKWLQLPILQKKVILAVIRNPIQQVLSHINYIQNIDLSHPLNKFIKDRELIDIVKDNEFINKLVNQQLEYIFNTKNILNSYDKIIIGKHEKLHEFITYVNSYYSIGSINLEKEKENVGGNYLDKWEKHPSYKKAITILNRKLKKEIEFYNSFDNILDLNNISYKEYNSKYSRL